MNKATTPVTLKGANTEEQIWNYLYDNLKNEYAVAGLMGNLYAESALVSINLQGYYNTKLGYSDQEYTDMVDKGEYDNFVRDSAGYGIAQWTYWTRKEALLSYAKATNRSIGDLKMQLEFLMKELREDFVKSVLGPIKAATSVREASDIVLTKFEQPKDQGEAMQEKRAAYGQGYYDKYAGKSFVEPVEPEPVEPEVELETKEEIENNSVTYKVLAGVHLFKFFANKNQKNLESAGFDSFVYRDKFFWKVQAGAYFNEDYAFDRLVALKEAGFGAIIVEQ
jgi:hypothetical protein